MLSFCEDCCVVVTALAVVVAVVVAVGVVVVVVVVFVAVVALVVTLGVVIVVLDFFAVVVGAVVVVFVVVAFRSPPPSATLAFSNQAHVLLKSLQLHVTIVLYCAGTTETKIVLQMASKMYGNVPNLVQASCIS